MVSVNGIEMNPNTHILSQASGIIAVEGPDGHQQWALVVDAQIRYDDDVTVSYGSSPQFTVIATLPPGEMLRQAQTIEPGEENVLVYSRLLVEVLREERERYSELERRFGEQGVQLRKAREEAGALAEDRDEMLWAAWRQGATEGWLNGYSTKGKTLDEVLGMNPHPELDETDGCHICGGPDH